jgi:hypothetical protein
MLDVNQTILLYNKSKEELTKSANSRSVAADWKPSVNPTWAYKLALEITGKESCTDEEIWVAIISAEGYLAIEAVALNEYYFWRIVYAASLGINLRTKLYAVNYTISEMRAGIARLSIDRKGIAKSLADGSLTANLAVMATSVGLLLWDRRTELAVLNPLYFTESEWEKL